MITENAQLVEQAVFAQCLAATTPSTTSPRRVSMKGFERATVFISGLNATTVTGSAITLKQDNDISDANSAEKTLAFTNYYANLDVATNGVNGLSAAVASSNTFTTTGVNSKEFLYVIEVTPDMMDIANGFDCLRVGTGNGVATTINVHILLWPAKYGTIVPGPISPGTN
jgi:hypothetical protein